MRTVYKYFLFTPVRYILTIAYVYSITSFDSRCGDVVLFKYYLLELIEVFSCHDLIPIEILDYLFGQ